MMVRVMAAWGCEIYGINDEADVLISFDCLLLFSSVYASSDIMKSGLPLHSS